MAGRPINKDRQDAIEFGFPTYVGVMHRRCGTTERYTNGGGCVHCARVIASEQREARKLLLQHREQFEDDGAEVIAENLNADGYFDSDQIDTEHADGLDVDNREELDAEARREASFDELM
jgi:hypothetical protein